MFDMCTRAHLDTLSVTAATEIHDLCRRHFELLSAAAAEHDHDRAHQALAAARVALAAMDERHELLHAVNLEFTRRNTEEDTNGNRS
jgi:hypothetical protein